MSASKHSPFPACRASPRTLPVLLIATLAAGFIASVSLAAPAEAPQEAGFIHELPAGKNANDAPSKLPPATESHPQRNAARMKRFDTDGDGRINIAEFYKTGPAPLRPRMEKVFDSIDKDHAGSLSFEDALKVIIEVSGLRPKLDPEVDGTFQPILLEVSPKTKRAVIEAAINGVKGRFLLDTGTTDTIINTDFAKRAGVDFVEICIPVVSGNYGKKGDIVSLIGVPDMEMAGTHFRNFHAVLMTNTRTYEFGGTQLDGTMGANVLFAKQVTLDYRKQAMTFTKDAPDEFDFCFDLIPKRQKTAAVHADLDGGNIILMLDSGAAIGDAILINEPYHAAIRKLAGSNDAKTYRATKVCAGKQVIASDITCLLRPFEETVIGSYFFDRHVITVNTKTDKAWVRRNR